MSLPSSAHAFLKKDNLTADSQFLETKDIFAKNKSRKKLSSTKSGESSEMQLLEHQKKKFLELPLMNLKQQKQFSEYKKKYFSNTEKQKESTVIPVSSELGSFLIKNWICSNAAKKVFGSITTNLTHT